MARRQEDFERQTRDRGAQFEREQDAVRERQARIDDNMIVQGELVARLELRVDQMVARIDDFVPRIDSWIETAKTQIAELQVLVRTAHERLDQGR